MANPNDRYRCNRCGQTFQTTGQLQEHSKNCMGAGAGAGQGQQAQQAQGQPGQQGGKTRGAGGGQQQQG